MERERSQPKLQWRDLQQTSFQCQGETIQKNAAKTIVTVQLTVQTTTKICNLEFDARSCDPHPELVITYKVSIQALRAGHTRCSST